MIKEAIAKIIKGENLDGRGMQAAMEEIMSGAATPAQIASFLTALRMKGETVGEITAAALVMRAFARKVELGVTTVLDTCGTGGDETGTFNISTISAFVAAGAGAVVAKHGNRAVSSRCGSADLLEELGVKIELRPEEVKACIQKIGIGFLFAPLLHDAMRYAAPVRRDIGVRTIFNILGPLTNPAGAAHQLLGVYDKSLVRTMALVLKNLGSKHALIVHGECGLDEAATTGKTVVAELKNGRVRNYAISPRDFGIKTAKLRELAGGDRAQNAKLAREILSGKEGAPRDVVVLNAGCAIYAADAASSIASGVELAKRSIDSGSAMDKLDKLIEFTRAPVRQRRTVRDSTRSRAKAG